MAVKLSPSTLKLLKECPRCFWLQVNKGIKRPAGIFPSLPSGMDKVLKEHFDACRERGELPQELRQLGGVQLFKDKELLDAWSNNRKGITWEDKDGNVLKGAVDYLLTKGDKIIVLDFKTRGYPLKEDTAGLYQDQLDIYNYLLRKNGRKTEGYAYLLFYHPESVNKTGHFLFHAELVRMDVSVRNAEQVFTQAVTMLAGKMPKPAAQCGFCAWQQLKI